MSEKKKKIIKTFRGVVVSSRLDKTIVVLVNRFKLHPRYHKRYRVSRKYQVHDPKNQYQVGDLVGFVECRPLSRQKRWRVIYQPKKSAN